VGPRARTAIRREAERRDGVNEIREELVVVIHRLALLKVSDNCSIRAISYRDKYQLLSSILRRFGAL